LGLDGKFGEREVTMGQMKGEAALLGRARHVPAGWAPQFALVPECRGGKVVTLRNVMDPGKLFHAFPPRHALLIGCTGMLADTAKMVAKWANATTVVTRDAERNRHSSDDSKTHIVEGDWNDPGALRQQLQRAAETRGKFDLAVLWVHQGGEALWPLLNSLFADRARVYEILGSADVDALDSIPDHASDVPEAAYRRVVLGRANDGDGDRWLTWEEISKGVSRLVRRDRSGVVGH
jgi:NADPH:quinone reductase-like Zn-dependent oxidoreductase